MSDQASQPATSAPPVAAANRLALTMNNTDVTIAFGQTRQAYDQEGKQIATATEYSSAVSLSPPAAKQLLIILANAVKQYEERWGSIGLDPSFVERVETKMRATEVAPKKQATKRRAATQKSK
ncbi:MULTISPECIES: DUF3467 domain-containing protein [unclassified Hydrogenophaga]|uniref:DUF3467 domain-containing protein n=1 Tax=unclassified Hydrogenophaga TaxID=2610897 RepID=UPI001AC5ADA4|nr:MULTISPECIES: DUF3467 domain-containing protein [unclassified Hydrogenophaga]MBN9370981.1 DUF3467 domain-containing protein [Hydrogenophaga sp.]